ncbi:hypothetical protein [Engelhardtia mirabilis]|uniref:Uncharacterized protein n=1 Tax=Engelhardtia mirabilis TaxID=2528011 RepID=A0A518BGK9_9BACT|nr:hypothetical protein Pla133_11940 [Planctomycetes bacterium Pla133]QDV00455.1 hypothetical protein Pla86_11940 [Planctomycetes bacterium Pla86]
MSGDPSRDLDQLAARATAAMRSAASREGLHEGLRRSLPLIAVVPAIAAGVAALRWQSGVAPDWVPPAIVVLTALALPLVAAATASARAWTRPVQRDQALGQVDRQLGLKDRLVTADEFLRSGRSGPFERAAIADAAAHLARALAQAVVLEVRPWNVARRAAGCGALGAVALAAFLWLAARPVTSAGGLQTEEVVAAAAGPALTPADEPVQDEPERAVAPEDERPTDPPRPRESRAGERPASAPTPELSDVVKESAGKSGAGRSAGALSSSSASQSRSAPSTQGQASKPSERKLEAKPSQAKRPEPEEAPEPPESKEDDESGATAGRGASKGSNKNPTASDWRSRDQVTNEDDQDIDDDEDTADDEEEQESRGGVQPNLRDRRPPVSRDLQIGFGNRANPDANGRGGPSQPKKSRGVASLVLGVPIPDRVKGRPGPGPTKITQERIEPEGEEAVAIEASARTPRRGPAGRLSSPDLEPALRDLVRAYFLTLRSHEGTP